jgi:predicted nucleic acid-binding protein
MVLLLDTSVWVDHLRHGSLAALMPAIRGKFVLWMDAVAAAELVAGCRSRRERLGLGRILRPFQKAGRIASPSTPDFLRAATAISRLREAGTTLRNPGSALLDGLMAAVACRMGALLVTQNEDDFRALGTRLPLTMESLVEFSRRMGVE